MTLNNQTPLPLWMSSDALLMLYPQIIFDLKYTAYLAEPDNEISIFDLKWGNDLEMTLDYPTSLPGQTGFDALLMLYPQIIFDFKNTTYLAEPDTKISNFDLKWG